MLSRKCNSVARKELISHLLGRMGLILLSLLVSQSYSPAQWELGLCPIILAVPEERMIKYSRDHWMYFRLDEEICANHQKLYLCFCHWRTATGAVLSLQAADPKSSHLTRSIFQLSAGQEEVLKVAHFLVSKPFCWFSGNFPCLSGVFSMQLYHRRHLTARI